MPLIRHALLTALKIFTVFALVVVLVSWWAYSSDAAGMGEDNVGGWLLLFITIPVMLASQVLGFAMVVPGVSIRNVIVGSVFYYLVFTFIGLWWALFRQARQARAARAKTGRG